MPQLKQRKMKKIMLQGTSGLMNPGTTLKVIELFREFSIKTYLLIFAGVFLLIGAVVTVT